MSKRFYLTTPIYYVNSAPHIGSALTTFVCDATRRYQIMRGENPYFLTGTDENALKVMEAAEKAGVPTQQFVDDVSHKFKQCWAALDIRYDDFIRTTERRHIETVQRFFEALRLNGYVYLGKYEGWYDVGAETFVKESELVDGKSPDGNEVRWVSEENWFFKLSAFEQRLLDHIENNPGFLLPESRKNEVVSFIKQGLRDMCITRQNPGWGIPVPGDDTKVIYVWFDALINYMSATGWPNDGWEDLWPADIHWMAKEIFTRFHATLWPAMLMGVDLPLPKTVIAHGWFTFGDEKISKSKGNAIDPIELVKELTEKSGCEPEMAVDAVRYSLAALLPYEGDTNYTRDEVDKRYNADLANDLGNALNRTLAMAHKFVDGKIPGGDSENEARDVIADVQIAYENAMDQCRIDSAVDSAWGLIRYLNKYIDTKAPWALAKNNDPSLGQVMRSMLLCLRSAEGLIRPIMPKAADAIAEQLGLEPLSDWSEIGEESSLPERTRLQQPKPMFPRIDLKKAQPVASPAPAVAPTPKKTAPEPPGEITIEDFMKVRLKVGRVLEAEPVEGSRKLMKLQVMIGEEKRQILAGIRTSYEPLDLVGRQVIVVANLKPAKLMGMESQGMLLAADGPDGGAIFLTPESEAPEGTDVH